MGIGFLLLVLSCSIADGYRKKRSAQKETAEAEALERVFEDNMKIIQSKLNRIEEERDSILAEAKAIANNHNEVDAKKFEDDMERLRLEIKKVVKEELDLIRNSGLDGSAYAKQAPELNEEDC